MPDGGRRKSTDAVRTHALVGFPPGDGVQPSKTSVIEPIYLFGSAHVGAATISPYPRPVETVHTSTDKDNTPRIRQQLLAPHSVSQKSFARTSAPARARPCSFPPNCTKDEECFEQMTDHPSSSHSVPACTTRLA